MTEVYVAFLDADGFSKVLGVYKNFTDAMALCNKEALEYANSLYPKDYKYEKLIYSEGSICVDTFVWRVVNMKIIE